MKSLVVILICAAALGLPAPVSAQNRTETQLLLELRTVQEQLQRMQLSVNQLADRVKNAEARLDAQASDTRKGFADQKVFVDALAATLRTLNEREGQSTTRVAQLSQEMKSIRDGLAAQQSTLNEIVNLLQPLSAAAFASAAATGVTDPAAATGAGAG